MEISVLDQDLADNSQVPGGSKFLNNCSYQIKFTPSLVTAQFSVGSPSINYRMF